MSFGAYPNVRREDYRCIPIFAHPKTCSSCLKCAEERSAKLHWIAERDIFNKQGTIFTTILGGPSQTTTSWEIAQSVNNMNTIQHTDTLVYYDGVQVFEGRDAVGGCYVGMMIASLDDIDRYLVSGVVPPESLRLFRSGALDLKTLMLRGAEDGWYITETDGDFTQPLVLQAQSDALTGKDFLPDDGFLLCKSALATV